MLGDRIDDDTVVVHGSERGNLKQALLKLGWPAEDFAGYVDGEAHPIALDETEWHLRDYQRDAAESFWHGGSGVVVLPCGAGKTLVGAAAMAHAQATTLILVTNTVSARQWKDELVRRTSLTEDEIGEYSGAVKEIRPVTIATYQVLTTRRKGVFPHLELLDARDWGLIVYDEVHLLPAPIFRMTANLQARRRIGLTATLVREDGREGDVFSLIGPKRYDAPWKDIEAQGWIAPADCVEVRVTLPTDERLVYATAEADERYRLASCTHHKIDVVRELVEAHPGQPTLVIGQYIDQLDEIAAALDAPVIKGETSVKERQRLFDAFRSGEVGLLVVSKVANFSIDLPSAEVAIQVSGSFGSRQEEAQRLGRLLRPKEEGKTAHFYTIVSRDTVDAEFAQNRQRFLAEQGYAYRIVDADPADLRERRARHSRVPSAMRRVPLTSPSSRRRRDVPSLGVRPPRSRGRAVAPHRGRALSAPGTRARGPRTCRTEVLDPAGSARPGRASRPTRSSATWGRRLDVGRVRPRRDQPVRPPDGLDLLRRHRGGRLGWHRLDARGAVEAHREGGAGVRHAVHPVRASVGRPDQQVARSAYPGLHAAAGVAVREVQGRPAPRRAARQGVERVGGRDHSGMVTRGTGSGRPGFQVSALRRGIGASGNAS